MTDLSSGKLWKNTLMRLAVLEITHPKLRNPGKDRFDGNTTEIQASDLLCHVMVRQGWCWTGICLNDFGGSYRGGEAAFSHMASSEGQPRQKFRRVSSGPQRCRRFSRSRRCRVRVAPLEDQVIRRQNEQAIADGRARSGRHLETRQQPCRALGQGTAPWSVLRGSDEFWHHHHGGQTMAQTEL